MAGPRSAFAFAADTLDPPVSPYVDDPAGWVHDRVDGHLTLQQRSIVESVRDHRYTAVHSAHDLGKSFTAANVAAWWIDVHPPGTAAVVSTAPSFPQVRAILWKEIGRAHRKGHLPGRVNQTEWWLDEELVGFGRKPADYDPAAFQGIHALYVLVVIDEACGVPKTIFDAVDALATNEYARVLAIGNPDDSTSHFAEVCKPGSGWNVIHLDGLESPNFTDEPIPEYLRPLLLSPVWVEERKSRWGETSPLYIAKVRGLFPEDADDGVVRASKIAKCRIPREYLPDEAKLLEPVELGVDVGAGGDFTSIRERRGVRAGRVWRDHSADPEHTTGVIVRAIDESGAKRIKIDSNGIGHGIAGWVAEKRPDVKVVRVNVGEASSDKKRFPRLRDEIWWDVGRELSETGGWDLSDADVDDDTVAQLLAPKYSLDASGRVKVEQKDETRKRLGRSPDDADALLLAFYAGRGSIEDFMGQLAAQKQAEHGADPDHPLSR